jgi:acetylornithine deacetylase/succinyl-diaminopimelate desuccinylase-like protein
MQAVQSYIQANRDRFLEELLDMLRIPSISADPAYKAEVSKNADLVAESLRKAGADNVRVIPTAGHPVVYGEKWIGPDKPTVLVYGHYDVQPPDPLDLWTSGPFDPVIRQTDLHPEGAIYARGSADDKGQFFMHVKAFEAMLAEHALPCNVKFMIEGEEEVGSAHLEQFLNENASMLGCDVILISDTHMISRDTPSITVGLRGLSYVEVEVTGPCKDLHSGLYGGAVANPVNILAKMIAALHDENNHITIPGFYDDVLTVTPEERKAMNEAPFDEAAYRKELQIQMVHGEAGYTTLERTSIRPTLDVNGIWGGYTGEGAKTVLPAKAFAKISMRLVPNQDPEKITDLFARHFKSLAPPSVEVKVHYHHGGYPVVTPTDTPEYQAAHKAMEKAFGKAPIPQRGGGSIPIVPLFEKVLGVKTVLMGFGLDTDSIHSPNEHYGLFFFYKGIETIPYFYQYYAALKAGAKY